MPFSREGDKRLEFWQEGAQGIESEITKGTFVWQNSGNPGLFRRTSKLVSSASFFCIFISHDIFYQ
jgi:hypothetical protein